MEERFLLKDIFNPGLVRDFGERLIKFYPGFELEKFVESFTKHYLPLALKERSDLITENLRTFLPADFPDAIKILLNALIPEIGKENIPGYGRFIIMPQTAYIGRYGLEYFEISMHALYEMTKRFSSEFDIRFFIEKYPEKSLEVLQGWTNDPNEHVRRLVSEGTRSRLPWGKRLRMFQQNPEPVIKLLERLKEDPSEYVRRSVANNLNDIAKDKPERVVEILNQWNLSQNTGTRWIVKHAARSLIKQGHNEVLTILGFDVSAKIQVQNLVLKKSTVQSGEDLCFTFEVKSADKIPVNIVVDYQIHFLKANKKHQPKVFKISTCCLKPGEVKVFSARYSFRPKTTRKFYSGEHYVTVQVNGKEFGKEPFIYLP